ncbi:hypothetical protein D3C79_1081950 [compost metagenome]
MGIDKAKHRDGLRGGQALDQVLRRSLVSHHRELADKGLPALLPLPVSHQSSSRFERTHSTWRLIRKPKYKGTFLAA